MKLAKISWDWKSGPDLKALRKALTPLGVQVYEDPTFEGSDSFGYLFSDKPLTSEEVANVTQDEDDGDE